MKSQKDLTTRLRPMALVAVSFTASIAVVAGQVTFRVVGSMNGKLQQPIGITEGSPGTFYTTGGSPNPLAFSITKQGAKTILATFGSNDNLLAPLVSGSNGRLYSSVSTPTTVNAYSVTSAANSKEIYSAQSVGFMATQNLPDGNLLGTAATLAASPSWFVAESDLKGNVTTIYAFPSGETLPHTLIHASDGNYYGVSIASSGSGYVYRVTPDGVFSKLWSSSVGAFGGPPLYVPLLQADDGNLYGATTSALGNTNAMFFRLTLDGQYTLLYTFPSGINYQPSALIEGSDGNFYGSTLGVGSKLFRLTKSGTYTELYTMNAIRDGQCLCQLTLGSDGIVYGSAQGQGKYGAGDIFALDVGMPIPRPWAQQFTPSSGSAGTRVRIWGKNLLSATVSFNGAAAVDISSSGPNYVWATVPAGAASGRITVSTPGGSNTTEATFTVP